MKTNIRFSQSDHFFIKEASLTVFIAESKSSKAVFITTFDYLLTTWQNPGP